MSIVDRLNRALNEVIHCGLAEVGHLLEVVLEPLSRKAMANALNRDYGLTYDEAVTAATDALADGEAECEVHEAPSKCRVCIAGEYGQRLHKCPDSPYYIPGSDPGAELTAPPLPVGHADLAARIAAATRVWTADPKGSDLGAYLAGELISSFRITT
ncbi:gp53 [Mycobacterium phage Che9c]|uniref:Uncharacterized protein n=1 Tax=Mycobacterium phage Che9c TaxID=2907832 RepID=Q854U7_9CAUD|nr:gp53 [Mycobacterium phage Che9c]AAN12611.1 hypothetical protein PBI_CHE9C_53 [Mycobacterium phage Che9c]